MSRMPVLHWTVITFIVYLVIARYGINSQRALAYEDDAARRFMLLHGRDVAIELARRDAL